MGVKVANNAVSTIVGAISSSDAGITVATGTGSLFPILGTGDYFYATLSSTAGVREIVKVTVRTGDTMSITRAQEGTIAQSFASGSRIELRITAASVTDMIAEHDQASEITFAPTGGIAATNVQSAIAELDSEAAKSVALAASGGSALVGFVQSGTGASSRTLQSKNRDIVSVKDFGAVGDGVADDRAAFQAACDASYSVYIPEGTYLIGSTIYLRAGVTLKGAGHQETSAGTTVKLLQGPACGDVIRFNPIVTGGVNYWYGEIAHLSIWGDITAASGWAISARTSTNATVRFQDMTRITDISIRRMKSGGIEIPNGALPVLVSDIKVFWCGGPGIHYTGGSFVTQIPTFINISGDGNVGELMLIESLDARATILFIGIKAEKRINSDYGTGAQQPYAIRFKNCVAGSVAQIIGLSQISSVPDGANFEKPGDAIYLDNSPEIDVRVSCAIVRVRAGDTGTDPFLIGSSGSTVQIPYTLHEARNYNGQRIDYSPYSTSYWSEGVTNSYPGGSTAVVEAPARMLAGASPFYGVWETDEGADQKGWIWGSLNGNFILRAKKDDGSSGGGLALSITKVAGVTDSFQIKRALNSLGTTLIVGNWALSAGFGSTAAITINASSKDSRFDINIAVSGTGIAANPTATLTFSDGAFATAPIGVVAGWNETDSTGVSLKWVESTTTLVITFLGTPVTGKTYRIKGVLM